MSFVPCTPAGTLVVTLAADTYQEAKKRLVFDTKHMPYRNWEAMKKRGYSIVESGIEVQNPPIFCGYGLTHEYK